MSRYLIIIEVPLNPCGLFGGFDRASQVRRLLAKLHPKRRTPSARCMRSGDFTKPRLTVQRPGPSRSVHSQVATKAGWLLYPIIALTMPQFPKGEQTHARGRAQFLLVLRSVFEPVDPSEQVGT